MLVTCNHCDTTYNLPDDKAAPGAKLRCTVCKNVFKLEPKQEEEPLAAEVTEESNEPLSFDGFGGGESTNKDDKKKKKLNADKKGLSKKGLLIVIALLILISGGSFALWQFTGLLDPVKSMVQSILSSGEVPAISEITATDKVRLLELRNVRQYNINNEKVGKISVIEGKIINGFDSPRELIKVEGTLFDAEGKVLVSKSLLAGTSVSLFQLQVLGMEELEHSLGNSVEIVANNTNVAPQSIVPFMILFYNPPAEATEFGVRIIDAKTVEIVEEAVAE